MPEIFSFKCVTLKELVKDKKTKKSEGQKEKKTKKTKDKKTKDKKTKYQKDVRVASYTCDVLLAMYTFGTCKEWLWFQEHVRQFQNAPYWPILDKYPPLPPLQIGKGGCKEDCPAAGKRWGGDG